jgi:hypothetical protein
MKGTVVWNALKFSWAISRVNVKRFRNLLGLHHQGRCSECQSQSSVATDGQSVSPSWCRALSGAHDQMLRTVRQLRFCQSGALSDERSGLSFVIVFVSLLSVVDRWYIQLLLVKKHIYIYIQYIHGLCQSRLRTADHALPWVAQATTAA